MRWRSGGPQRRGATALEMAAFEQFGDAADEYCEVVASPERFRSAEEAAAGIASCLTTLVAAAQRLPAVEPATDTGSDTVAPRVSHEEWRAVFGALDQALGEHASYWTTTQPTGDDEPEVVNLPLADDLADIWRDLESGRRALRAGADPDDVRWEWRFSFTTHWGAHAGEALRVLLRRA